MKYDFLHASGLTFACPAMPKPEKRIVDPEAMSAARRAWCEYCNGAADWRGFQVHHHVRRGQGGSDVPDNLFNLCAKCHLDAIHTSGRISRAQERAFAAARNALERNDEGLVSCPYCGRLTQPRFDPTCVRFSCGFCDATL